MAEPTWTFLTSSSTSGLAGSFQSGPSTANSWRAALRQPSTRQAPRTASPRLSPSCGTRPRATPASVSPAPHNPLLAGSPLGLGPALTPRPPRYAEERRIFLDLPAGPPPMAVIPLGWPGARLGGPRRLPLAERVHVDRFGQRW